MTEPKGAKARCQSTHQLCGVRRCAQSLRGALTIWLDKDMQWCAQAIGSWGRQRIFSDEAIQFCLNIKRLFGLALRQSLGLVESLLRMASLDWRAPEELAGAIALPCQHQRAGPAVDSARPLCVWTPRHSCVWG